MEPTLRPWEALTVSLPKPEQHDYGYVRGQRAVGCTREELLAVCARAPWSEIRYVWTPETEELVPPDQVPFLFPALERRTMNGGTVTLAVGGVFVLVAVAVIVASGFNQTALMIMLLMLGVPGFLCVVYGLVQILGNRRARRSWRKGEADRRYAIWLNSQRTTHTPAITACIVVVAVAQTASVLRGHSSIEAAGLVVSSVFQGQYWRLLTCTLLHGNVFHLWMNLTGLLSLGRLTEVFTARPFVSIVFLASALCGSIFSLFLPPDSTSIGASGGLMGLFGFLAVAAFRRREVFPAGFLRSIVWNIILIAGVGLAAFMFIDNGAHLGGLLCGIGLGVRLIKRGHRTFRMETGRAIHWVGLISLLVIGTGGAVAIAAIFDFTQLAAGAVILALLASVYAIARRGLFGIMKLETGDL